MKDFESTKNTKRFWEGEAPAELVLGSLEGGSAGASPSRTGPIEGVLAALASLPVVLLVAVCCLLPLGWMALQISTNLSTSATAMAMNQFQIPSLPEKMSTLF